MSNNLRLAAILELVDKFTAPANRMTPAARAVTRRLAETREQVKKLGRSSRDLDNLNRVNRQLSESATKLANKKQHLGTLWRSFKEAESAGRSTKRLRQQIDTAQNSVQRLSSRHRQLKTTASQVRDTLRKAGVDTRNYARAKDGLADQTERLNRRLERQRKVMGILGNAQQRYNGMLQKTKRLAAATVFVGAALGFAVGRPLLNTARQFDDLLVTLEVLEGTSDKAKKSMDWVSTFAAKTPFEIGELTESFVKLRSYGLDPTSGLMRTLGDTASAMGKTIDQAVEAVADAVTGENERLKEFGITADVSGSDVTYNYTDKAGTQQAITVAKGDRQAIEQALTGIWDEKFMGSMEKRSKRFSGVWSNIMDTFVRIQQMIMSSGAFQVLTDELRGFLGKLNEMEANGSLQEWAEGAGQTLATVLRNGAALLRWLWDVGSAVYGGASKVASFVGGWENLAIILVSFKAASIITGIATAVYGLGTALSVAGFAAMANPIGIVVGLLVAAGLLIWRNWDAIKGGAVALVRDLTNLFLNWTLPGIIIKHWDTIISFFSGLPARFVEFGRQIIGGLISGVKGAFSGLLSLLSSVTDLLPGVVKNKLGIQSPSRVFAGIGANMLQGMAVGIDGERKPVIDRVRSLSGQIAAAGAGVAMSAAVAASPVSADQPMPAGRTGDYSQHHYAITITQQPGENADELAERVMHKIASRQARRRNSSYSDLEA